MVLNGEKDVAIVKIRLGIGMSPEAWEAMQDQGPYVVVWRREEHHIMLVGSAMEGRPHTTSTIPGADIQDTDLRPIVSFEVARHIRDEVDRQGRGVGRGAYLATFLPKE